MSNLHSMQFEQYVLATIMTIDDSLNNLKLKPIVSDFYAVRHQEIFKAIENLNIQGKAYDLEVVSDYFSSLNQLNLIGGEQYLIDLSSSYTSPASINTYIEKLKKLSECRKIEDVGLKIVELAQNTLLDDLPSKAQEIVAGVESVVSTDTRVDLQSSAIEALEILTMKIEHKNSGNGLAYGVNTGLKDLDAMLGDLEPTHYVVVAAAPGSGKTTLAQMIALNAVKRNEAPTVFFSCEMAHYEITSRIISAQGKIPYMNIQNGEMTADDYGSWVHLTSSVFPKYPLDIVDKAGITIQEIRGEIKKTIAKHGKVGCVIVDYLQLVRDPKYKEQFDVITEVSKGLKKIAKDFKVPVIALSQLTKEAQGRKITMADLRGSGQISQDSDKIILLSPDPKAHGLVIAEVAKNRQGKKGEVRLQPMFDFCQFANVANYEDF